MRGVDTLVDAPCHQVAMVGLGRRPAAFGDAPAYAGATALGTAVLRTATTRLRGETDFVLPGRCVFRRGPLRLRPPGPCRAVDLDAGQLGPVRPSCADPLTPAWCRNARDPAGECGPDPEEALVTTVNSLRTSQSLSCPQSDHQERHRARSGASNSQIYHHLADKAALVRAVIEFRTDAVLEPQQCLFTRLDTMEGLREWRDFAVDRQRELNCRAGCPIASLTSQLAEHDEAARLQLALSFRRWSAGLQAGIAAMHAKGALRPGVEPETLATVLLTALQGGLLLAQLNRDTHPLEIALDAALAHIESQLTGPEGR
ncbi:TetR family transcriptional regulator C-terminal domain-containing protein [Streptomyces nodosus]